MKKFLLTLLWLPSFLIAQQSYFDTFKTLDPTHISTGILYDRVFPQAQLTSGNFFASSQHISQALAELYQSDYLDRFPSIEEVKSLKKQQKLDQSVYLALCIAQLQKLNSSAFEENYLQLDASGQLTQIQPLQTHHLDLYEVALASPLSRKHYGLTVHFVLPESLLINTLSVPISSMTADFGTGEIHTIIPNQKITINYNQIGVKNIHFYIQLEDGTSYTLSSQIEILENESRFVEMIESTLAFQGYDETEAFTGLGEYEIYIDTVDGVLDKPIIFLDGFDPGDSRPIGALYQALTYSNGNENLADEARALGYDIVLLNFPVYQRNNGDWVDGGVDYIQRNAFVLIELINLINSQKEGDEELVIIGPSMGGLISRYALTYMENNEMDHQTRLWVSFDSPHLGANIMIGLQHLINYIAYGPMGDVTIQEVVDAMLRSPAAKQMLIDHLDAHLLPGDPIEFDPTIVLPMGAPNFRDTFQTEMDNMGFPQNTRNITVANGAGNGTTTGTAGMTLIDYEFYPEPGGSTRALIDTYFAPAASQTERINRVRTQLFIFIWITLSTIDAYSMAPAHTAGLDSAPGGQFDIGALAGMAGDLPIIQEFLDNLQIDKFNFIPTLSSLAITETNDWYTSVTTADVTVFDNSYIPDENEIHMTLTENNVNFVKEEIFTTLGTEQYSISKHILLDHNPIGDKIVLHGHNESAQLTLTDLSGKKLLDQPITLQGRTEIPVALTPGIYLLSLELDTEQLMYKLIKQ